MKTVLSLWLTKISWGVIALNILLIFVVPSTIVDSNTFIWLLFYAIWLIVTCVLAVTWLIIHYRSIFQTWWGWIIPLGLLILSSFTMQKLNSADFPHLSLLNSILFIISFWSVGSATSLLVWRRDIGLRLVAGWTILIIWVMAFSWRFQGNLIELWLADLSHPEQSPTLWWLHTLWCSSCWIVPLGLIGFFGHTFRLIIHECQKSDGVPI